MRQQTVCQVRKKEALLESDPQNAVLNLYQVGLNESKKIYIIPMKTSGIVGKNCRQTSITTVQYIGGLLILIKIDGIMNMTCIAKTYLTLLIGYNLVETCWKEHHVY